jgi:Protein of unknown function (DUF2752)
MNPRSTSRLAPCEKLRRTLYLAILPAMLLLFALVRPGSLPKWFPFPTSCGAMTGLPCIFCGTTRAFYHLLHGEFRSALYYNWLAYPFLAGALLLALTNAFEFLLSQNLLARIPRPRLTRARLCALAAGFVLLWCLQVYLAISQHKTELLNPGGPLYSLVVR